MHTDRIVRAFLLALLALAAAGCGRVSVHTMADPDASFGAYATFKILPRGGAVLRDAPPARSRLLDDPAAHEALHEAITLALIEKGLQPLRGEGTPDLVVGYQIATRNQAEVMPPIYGAGWRGHRMARHPAQVRWYKEGTLVIDLVEEASRSLVWRGIGVGALRDMHPGEALDAAVREIFNDFPPEP